MKLGANISFDTVYLKTFTSISINSSYVFSAEVKQLRFQTYSQFLFYKYQRSCIFHVPCQLWKIRSERIYILHPGSIKIMKDESNCSLLRRKIGSKIWQSEMKFTSMDLRFSWIFIPEGESIYALSVRRNKFWGKHSELIPFRWR